MKSPSNQLIQDFQQIGTVGLPINNQPVYLADTAFPAHTTSTLFGWRSGQPVYGAKALTKNGVINQALDNNKALRMNSTRIRVNTNNTYNGTNEAKWVKSLTYPQVYFPRLNFATGLFSVPPISVAEPADGGSGYNVEDYIRDTTYNQFYTSNTSGGGQGSAAFHADIRKQGPDFIPDGFVVTNNGDTVSLRGEK